MILSQLVTKWRGLATHNVSDSNAEWLFRCAAELEASMEDIGFDLQYIHDIERLNTRMEEALRKIAYEIPQDISGDEAATMCEEIASEFFHEEP